VIDRVVAIGGPPGSGKSSAGRRVAAVLDLAYRSAGDVFRADARERGMDLEAYGQYALEHPEIDRQLDETMQEMARPGVLLDGRIQAALAQRRGVPVYSILVTAAEEERARRVANRDGVTVPTALSQIRARTESERARYRTFYGIDLDEETADLSLDSTHLSAQQVSDEIVRYLRSRSTGGAG
jgi:cytidylate kinase